MSHLTVRCRRRCVMRLGRSLRFFLGISFAIVAVGVALGPTTIDRNSSFSLSKYIIEIGDERAAVSALQGGYINGTIVTSKNTDGSESKRIDGQVIDPVRVRMKVGQFKSFLAGALGDNVDRFDGKIFYVDESSRLRYRRDLKG